MIFFFKGANEDMCVACTSQDELLPHPASGQIQITSRLFGRDYNEACNTFRPINKQGQISMQITNFSL